MMSAPQASRRRSGQLAGRVDRPDFTRVAAAPHARRSVAKERTAQPGRRRHQPKRRRVGGGVDRGSLCKVAQGAIEREARRGGRSGGRDRDVGRSPDHSEHRGALSCSRTAAEAAGTARAIAMSPRSERGWARHLLSTADPAEERNRANVSTSKGWPAAWSTYGGGSDDHLVVGGGLGRREWARPGRGDDRG